MMNLIVGDAAGRNREFSVAVIELNASAVIVVDSVGIYSGVLRVLNVDSISSPVCDPYIRDFEIPGRRSLQMNGDSPDSGAFSVGNGVSAAHSNIFQCYIGESREVDRAWPDSAFHARMCKRSCGALQRKHVEGFGIPKPIERRL